MSELLRYNGCNFCDRARGKSVVRIAAPKRKGTDPKYICEQCLREALSAFDQDEGKTIVQHPRCIQCSGALHCDEHGDALEATT